MCSQFTLCYRCGFLTQVMVILVFYDSAVGIVLLHFASGNTGSLNSRICFLKSSFILFSHLDLVQIVLWGSFCVVYLVHFVIFIWLQIRLIIGSMPMGDTYCLLVRIVPSVFSQSSRLVSILDRRLCLK